MNNSMIWNEKAGLAGKSWAPGHQGLGFVAPIAAAAGRFLLPVVIGAGTIVGGGYLLQDQLNIDTSRIPLAAILAGTGAGAFTVADFVPEKYRPIAALVGIGGIAASAVYLFSGTEKKDDNDEIRSGIAPEDVFSALTGRITSPSDFTQVNRWRFQTTFPVTYTVSNTKPTDAPVLLDFVVDEVPTYLGGIKGQRIVNTHREVRTIPANGNLTEPIDVPFASRDLVGLLTGVDMIDINLKLNIRRTADSAPRTLSSRSFLVDF